MEPPAVDDRSGRPHRMPTTRVLRSAPAAAARGDAPQRRNGVLATPVTVTMGATLRPSVVFSRAKLHVTVGGSAAFYSAELTCMPEHPVTLAPSHLPTSLRVTPTLHVFTKQNWSMPQHFRVAAVGGAGFDDSSAGSKAATGGAIGASAGGSPGGADAARAFVQILEHYTSSMDPRYHGHRPLFLPGTLLVHVSPRDGACVFASGRVLGTARQFGKATATASHHDFRQLDVEPNLGGTVASGSISVTQPARGSLLARSSLVVASQQTPGVAAAIAAVDAANSAVAKRLASPRRSLVVKSASDAASQHGQDAADQSDTASGFLKPVGKEAQSFIKVACRKNQTLLLQRSGSVIMLGKRDDGPSTTTSTTTASLDPQDAAAHAVSEVALSKMLTDVDCGDDHVVAITEHGYLLTWGDGRDGRLGHGTDASRSTPKLLHALLHKRIVQVACGARHTLALAEDGDVFAWGYGRSGALGLATSVQSKAAAESVPTPMEVLPLKHRGVAKLACGDLHSVAVLSNGMLLTCGWAEHGRLGRAVEKRDEFSACFAQVDLGGRLCTFVACGGAHTLALTACSSVLAFGCNANGQLGLGDCRHRWTPTRIEYFDDASACGRDDQPDTLVVTGLAACKFHSFATTQDGRVFAWGSDEFGQCGVGSFPQIYTVPHLVPSAVGLGITQVAGGDSHSVVLGHTSQRHLDALEANHPTRYAQLMDRFEMLVQEDKARRTKVLLAAKQKQTAHETAVRHRKPPLDPTLPRGPRWQAQLHEASAAAREIVESAMPVRPGTSYPPRRPQTASASLATALAREKMRPTTGGARARTATPLVKVPLVEARQKTKVRCSSATLWRRTRLFTFEAAANGATTTTHTSDPPSLTGRATIQGASNHLKLTAQARQTLGRIFHGEGDGLLAQMQSKHDSDAQTTDSTVDREIKAEQLRVAAQFSSTRPKSAPSRAAVTRAS